MMNIPATCVLVLMNMVTAEELVDDEEYEDIITDIRSECAKFGKLEEIKIPRPDKEDEKKDVPGLGKVGACKTLCVCVQ